MRWPYLLAGLGVAAVYLVLLHVGEDRQREAEEHARQGHLAASYAQLGKAYALYHEGQWPSLDTRGRHFAYDSGIVPQGYAIKQELEKDHTPQAVLFGKLGRHAALSLVPLVDFRNYFYLGYAVTTEEEGLALAKALRSGVALDDRVEVAQGSGTSGSSTLYRLHDDIVKTLVLDGVLAREDPSFPARTPVLVERPRDGFAWVVYLDMHVERLSYPGPFPVTQSFVEALEAGAP
ncbi:MAG: hypothetical protein IT365_12670 [Candidatus Hydrogenedentes bacterium]|nr:hypothetical protein [Candidatus Hydrogenedentota bacterium]